MFVNKCISHKYINTYLTYISKSKGCFNVKSSTYYVHMKTKILADFQICISVPLILIFNNTIRHALMINIYYISYDIESTIFSLCQVTLLISAFTGNFLICCVSIKYHHFLASKPSSHPKVFQEKGVLKNFAKYTGKHLCWSLFFNKVAGTSHGGWRDIPANLSF